MTTSGTRRLASSSARSAFSSSSVRADAPAPAANASPIACAVFPPPLRNGASQNADRHHNREDQGARPAGTPGLRPTQGVRIHPRLPMPATVRSRSARRLPSIWPRKRRTTLRVWCRVGAGRSAERSAKFAEEATRQVTRGGPLPRAELKDLGTSLRQCGGEILANHVLHGRLASSPRSKDSDNQATRPGPTRKRAWRSPRRKANAPEDLLPWTESAHLRMKGRVWTVLRLLQAFRTTPPCVFPPSRAAGDQRLQALRSRAGVPTRCQRAPGSLGGLLRQRTCGSRERRRTDRARHRC